jgi:uncharacterized protein YhaN
MEPVPAPVILDDAFLESDDDRSEKIFESLAELAAKTQVIVLTHRPREIAEALAAPCRARPRDRRRRLGGRE